MDLSGKIENGLLGVFRDVSTVAASLGIPFFVIGATARDIVLEYGFEIQPSRATLDLDLGVRVADWEEFEALTKGLVDSGGFATSPAAQRFFHKMSSFPVDIVPFGKIATIGGAISWPPEHAVEMNIIGFEEAYVHAWIVRLSNDLEIRFASPAGWALLKIISWNERDRSARVKDARDLGLILRNYAQAGNVDRLYDEERALFQAEEYEFEYAGARLLGRDLTKIAKTKTLQLVQEILERETREQSQYRLVAEMETNRFAETDLFEYHLKLLMKLKQGILEVVEGGDNAS
ncbi:MAG: nucleotidyl transferase AbiEii/AbiGii toxin family protein [Desulfurivibrionaceae bacterium]